MAFVATAAPDDEQNKSVQGPVQLAPSSGVGTGGTSSGAAAPTGAPAAPAGGSFASLDKYLTANQGQAQPLANQITSSVQGQYNALNQGNQQVTSDLTKQVQGSGAPSNANDIISQEAANPISFASNPNNVQQFQGLLNATYGGPTSAESAPTYQAQRAAVNSTISQGQAATQNEAGIQTLLPQYERSPGAGVTALNSAILGSDPNALNKVETAYQPFQNLVTGLSSNASQIDQQIANQQAATTAANQTANTQLQKQTTGLTNTVNAELAQAQAQQAKYNQDTATVQQQLRAGIIPSALGVAPGLTDFLAKSIEPWYAAHPTITAAPFNYGNALPAAPAVSAPTLARAATAQDYQTQAALAALTGSSAGLPLNMSQATQAGTYQTPTLAPVNNNAIAQAMIDEMSQSTGQLPSGSGPAYNQFLSLIDALDTYLGQPNQYQLPPTTAIGGLAIPTIPK